MGEVDTAGLNRRLIQETGLSRFAVAAIGLNWCQSPEIRVNQLDFWRNGIATMEIESHAHNLGCR